MEGLRWIGAAVLCLIPLTFFRKHQPETALLMALGLAAAALAKCLTSVLPVFSALEELGGAMGGAGDYLDVLGRLVCLGLVSRVSAELCRDGGSQSLAALVEILGTAAQLTAAIPLLKAVLSLLQRYMG